MVQSSNHSSFLLVCTLCFRAFGDKSNPPSLPDVESEGEEVNEEEHGVDEREEQTEEQCTDGDTTTEQVCSTVEELSLTEREEEKDEKGKTGEEEEEAEHEDQKMTQGITTSKSFSYICV